MSPPAAQAAVIGQIDTFEDGTTQGWVVGVGPFQPVVPFPPVNVASGGPGGVNDNFLRLTSTGQSGSISPGSRLTALNASQWSGDYLAAGIGAIEMDVRNFGASDLSLRLLFQDGMGGPPTAVAFSTNALVLPTGGGWTHVVFPIAPSDLTAALGSVSDALSTATMLRIFHGAAPAFPGEQTAGVLGIDNIRALAVAPVPEPATILTLALGLAGATFRHGRGRAVRACRAAAPTRR